MANTKNSSSHVQMQAETLLFQKVQDRLAIPLEKNPKVPLANNGLTYIQPDFYSEEHSVVGEIFAHIGKPKKAQDNKIANDILKMLLLEELKGRKYRKIIVVCDEKEEKKLRGKSVLAESIRLFGIDIIHIEIDKQMQKEILQAQARQKMVNLE
nr:hypothetical protein [Clostridia bacterium]